MCRSIRNVVFVLACTVLVVASGRMVHGDICPDPAVYTGVSESPEWASWNCQHDESGWNDACRRVCGNEHWGAPTFSCSAASVCGYDLDDSPIYCSSVVLECHNDLMN